MSKRQGTPYKVRDTTKARRMLEGSHGLARDADAAVALLEEKVKDHDAVAMWMLGVCCEYGMGTEQDVKRAVKLYKRAAELGNTTADAQGAMINSDMILEQSGLTDLTFEGIDYINTNEDNGTAEAGIKVTQSEINQPFVFKVSLEEQADGYWKVVSVDNFADFIKALEDGRKEFIKDYLSQTALIIIDKEKILTENEANLNAALNLGTLGSSQTRTDLKNDIENKILPQLKELQEALQSVEVPKSAETLHNLRLKACESKIAYYQDYAKWLDNKDIKTLREATDNLKKAKTMEYEANLLTKRIEGQIK